VAHVRERARHDDGHRIVEEAALHLDFETDRLDAIAGRRSSDLGQGLSLVISLRTTTNGQMSRKRTSLALRVMKERRASTSSPINTENSSSAVAASSSVTWSSNRLAGSMVVSHSSLAFISPRHL